MGRIKENWLTDEEMFIGGEIVLFFILVAGTWAISNYIDQKEHMSKYLAPALKADPSLTPSPLALEIQSSPVPNTPTFMFEPTSTKVGESCTYGPPWINNIATSIPDGGYSEKQLFKCVNGYWDLGSGDWITQTGDWGKDGELERALIKFGEEGQIIDRIFFDLQGNRIPGPTK